MGRVLPDTVMVLVATEILLSGLSTSINSPGDIVGGGVGVGVRTISGIGIIVGAAATVGGGVAVGVDVGDGNQAADDESGEDDSCDPGVEVDEHFL